MCGDEVTIRLPSQSSGDVAKVVTVAPRRTSFARTDSRGRTEPLAANLSLLAVIVAPEPPPDPYIADRYLAGAALAGITGHRCGQQIGVAEHRRREFEASCANTRPPGTKSCGCLRISSDSVTPLKARLDGAVAMFVGQSGIGKSTLTNALVPESMRPTRTISESTGEGRHTTVSTALFRIPGSGELIDSPGVRDYAPPPVEDANVQVGWPEILALAAAVPLQQLSASARARLRRDGRGRAKRISPRRYESYKRLINIIRGLRARVRETQMRVGL